MRKGMTAAIIAGIVVLSGVLFLTFRRSEPAGGEAGSPASQPPADAARAGGEAAAAPSQESSSPDDVGDNLIEEAMGMIEETSTPQANRPWKALKAKWAVEKAEVKALREDINKRMDAAHRSTPKYRDIRDEMLAKAETLFDGVDRSDLKAILDLSQGERDAFWDKGGLSEPEAYEHGYLARAVLELTVEEHGEDFEFLSALRDSINTMTRRRYSERTQESDTACREENRIQRGYLWPIIDKQAGKLFSGEVELSIEGMLVMLDWVYSTRFVKEDSKPGLRWLVENAEAGGWAKILPSLEKGLQEGRYPRELFGGLWWLRSGNNRQWEMYTSDPKTYLQIKKRVPERPENSEMEVARLGRENSGRILPSFKGSKEFQRLSRAVWVSPISGE